MQERLATDENEIPMVSKWFVYSTFAGISSLTLVGVECRGRKSRGLPRLRCDVFAVLTYKQILDYAVFGPHEFLL